MEFKHLAAFTAVVRYQSFTKAARALFLTQPSVSAQVSQLEEELQTKLLEWTTKSIRLTAAGEVIIYIFKPVFYVFFTIWNINSILFTLRI